MIEQADVTDEDRARDDWDFCLSEIEDMQEHLDRLRQRIIDRRHEDRVSVTGHPGWSE